MDKVLVSGYISVKSIIESKSRPIYEILIDEERWQKVMSSNYHAPEKRQYESLKNSGITITKLNAKAFAELNPGPSAGGIAAYVGKRKYDSLNSILQENYRYYTVIDGIEDPYNLGYAIRSLYASGVDVLVIPERDFFGSTETIVRASAGASELIHICMSENIESDCLKMKEKGITLYATANSGDAKDLRRIRFKTPFCMIYGGEKRGISSGIISMCKQVIKIKYPRNCHYSLPAVNAISIISFEAGYQATFENK